MRKLLASLFLLPGLCEAQSDVPSFNPDFNGDSCYTVQDLTHLLSLFGTCGIPPESGTFFPFSDVDSCYSAFDLIAFLPLFSTCYPVEIWACGDPVEFNGEDYHTTPIGDQCWFAQNLATELYRNGDTIPTVLDGNAWGISEDGATCIFGEGAIGGGTFGEGDCFGFSPLGDACNELFSLKQFGRLYNFAAVTDFRGICPSGWKVPSDQDWTAMEEAIIDIHPDVLAVDILKSTNGWSYQDNGLNLVGFTANPGGHRHPAGMYYGAGLFTTWWSSTIDSLAPNPFIEYSWMRHIAVNSIEVIRGSNPINQGHSVRCIKE